MRNSYLIKDIKKGFLLCLILLISGISFGQTKILTAIDILNEHKKSLKDSLLAREKSVFKAEMKRTEKIPEKYIPSSDSLTIKYLVFHESNRTDIRLEEKRFNKGSITWDVERQKLYIKGLTYQADNGPGELPGGIDIKTGVSRKAVNKNIQGVNAFMEGYWPPEDKYFWEMFEESDNLKLREDMEMVDGHQTYVLEIKIPHDGRYTLWIDPAFGFNIRKFTYIKTDSDLSDWEPFELTDPTKGPSQRFPAEETILAMDSVKIEKIRDIFVPISGVYEVITTYSNGEQRISTEEYKRFDIELNPDFSKYPNAFALNVPNGARVVYNQDYSSKIKYEWRDGEVIEKVDQPNIQEIDNAK
ncbi:MAG: hypothetical protein JXA96_06460 [Sedimentisphaerales bacterium]|nr:hypothetical protein [Sedimentisphaerales bacterium]